MKKLCVTLLTLLLFVLPAFADSTISPNLLRAQSILQHLDICISDETVSVAQEQLTRMQQLWQKAGFTVPEDLSTSVYLLLTQEGFVQYDILGRMEAPPSDQVYAFDAEFFNIGGMYTEFLRGVQAIVPDAQITDVQEDLSEMTAAWDEETCSDGFRSVSFLLNGTQHVFRLASYGDWFNDEMISFVNNALKAGGYSGQLHCVSDPYDQIVILIYGDESRASVLRQVMGVPEPEPDPNEHPSLLDWLGSLFGL